MAMLQVKGLDDSLYRALCVRASMSHRSLSQQIVKLIQQFLASPDGDARQTTRAFLDLSGSWLDNRSARQIASTIRKARRSGRRLTRT